MHEAALHVFVSIPPHAWCCRWEPRVVHMHTIASHAVQPHPACPHMKRLSHDTWAAHAGYDGCMDGSSPMVQLGRVPAAVLPPTHHHV
ncbi:hypothetical protein HaLaN_00145 [Haematococcus lacustris]|uniref:Uncharacterized protein n=1 Tax=Haematococcus lacustris TaxID=44745 RepID=A0A699YEY9_HAELA|nr:hypothetical protein HaLaN_00145 [Haematococcus lacustris]